MIRSSIILIFAVLFFEGSMFSQNLASQQVGSGQWIKSWLLCGPVGLTESSDR